MSEEPVPHQRVGRPQSPVLLDVGVPQPMRSMVFNSWPLILAILAASYLFAVLFPSLGGLLLLAVPLAVLAAVIAGGSRARKIRLTVTDDVIGASSGKIGISCDRSHVESAVLVENFARRWWSPRTTSLILLDRDGRTALLLSGLLWPPAVLEQVIELMPDVPLERLEGKQSPSSLAARYPMILENTDGSDKGPPRR